MANCAFNIPAMQKQQRIGSIKKSPQTSSQITSERVHKKNSMSSTDTELLQYKRTRGRNSVDLSENQHKDYLLENIQKQKLKVQNMQALLKTVHEPQEDWNVEEKIKAKILENRILAENIKNLSLNEQYELNESTESIVKSIACCDNEIEILQKKYLQLSRAPQVTIRSEDREGLKGLSCENLKLRTEIKSLAEEVSKYNESSKSRGEFLQILSQVNINEEKYSELLNDNAALQKQLIDIKRENPQKSTYLDNLENLSRILSEISKIAYIAEKYSEGKAIDLSGLLRQNFSLKSNTVQEYLDKIRKALEKVRLHSTDLYAEQCGMACNPQ